MQHSVINHSVGVGIISAIYGHASLKDAWKQTNKQVQFDLWPKVRHQVAPVAGTALPATTKPILEAARTGAPEMGITCPNTGALLRSGTLGRTCHNTRALLQLWTLIQYVPLLLLAPRPLSSLTPRPHRNKRKPQSSSKLYYITNVGIHQRRSRLQSPVRFVTQSPTSSSSSSGLFLLATPPAPPCISRGLWGC
jgi:hypothetical protein